MGKNGRKGCQQQVIEQRCARNIGWRMIVKKNKGAAQNRQQRKKDMRTKWKKKDIEQAVESWGNQRGLVR